MFCMSGFMLDFNLRKRHKSQTCNSRGYVMKIKNVVLEFLLPCLLFAGCEKHNDKKDFIGEWKLYSVGYRFFCVESYYIIDYPKTAIYDFQKNGKLVITYVISGELQQSEHSYKCVGTLAQGVCNFGNEKDKRDPHSHRIQIDGQEYICIVNSENKTVKTNMRMIPPYKDSIKAIDDVDLVMMENEDIYCWNKYFEKIK